MQELKLRSLTIMTFSSISFNRTMQELKHKKYKAEVTVQPAFNRTMQELKLELCMIKQNPDGPLIAPCRN